jgi:hypothetical protein
MVDKNKRLLSQRISDKTTMDNYPGPNKESADKEISEYSKDVELIKRYGDDAMRSKTFNTRKKPQGRGGKTYMDKPKSINAGASRPATQSGTPKGK